MSVDKKARASIDEILHDGEKVTTTLRAVLSISNSSNANPTGLLALTGERVIFAGRSRHTITLVTHLLSDIRSVDLERSVLNSFLRLRTGDAAAPVVTTFRPEPGHAQAFADAVTAAAGRAPAEGATGGASGGAVRSSAPGADAAPASAPATDAASVSASTTDAAPASASGSTTKAASASAPAAPTPTADELAKVADLHDRGALTDEEFAAAKAKILGL